MPTTTTFCNNSKEDKIVSVNNGLYKQCSVQVDNTANTITLNHDIVNMGEVNGTEYDIAPYTIVVYVKMSYGEDADGNEQYFEDTIKFIQYPAIYVKANTNSDYSEGDATEDANDEHNTLVNSYYGTNYTPTIPNISFDTFRPVEGLVIGGGQYQNWNPNMYVIHVTSMSNNEYIIGDPREIEINESFIGSATWATAPAIYDGSPNRKLKYYYRTNGSGIRENIKPDSSKEPNDYVTGNVIAPIFRIASSYSVTDGLGDYEDAEKRCASYQEDGYPAGRWRMPTFSEVKFLCTLSEEGKIPPLFSNIVQYWCAHGPVSLSSNGNVTLSPDKTPVSVRCVYDEWYWGSGQITDKSKFTWGDYPRDAWRPSGN